MLFRFIDTAGIRDTQDQIEAIGVQKAKEKIEKASVILFLFDDKDNTVSEITTFVKENYREGAKYVLLHNKNRLIIRRDNCF